MRQQHVAFRLPRVVVETGDRAMTFPIERSAFCRLGRNHRGARIRCSRGTLWVTQPGDPADYILRAGDGLTVTRPGMILVQALSDAAVQLTPGDRRR